MCSIGPNPFALIDEAPLQNRRELTIHLRSLASRAFSFPHFK
jgi:hypothetical protein